ncbi:hypothetical protein BGW36DRAFT_196480 [Talaromyces proteolyticus]|uniref:Uncharacterized protein n=1 Tax=Talaromyces proteolyticus TaxID=1131652 RepID=A0AAD4KMJ7_9EURO|nr:uncharacterized protein BGW36DRAFT_196480 [Talaromyces proteolyticus]KAH8695062.1 hypothetical protein BGW36DRAFT_196480 [Talaromyces proteolyticus]
MCRCSKTSDKTRLVSKKTFSRDGMEIAGEEDEGTERWPLSSFEREVPRRSLPCCECARMPEPSSLCGMNRGEYMQTLRFVYPAIIPFLEGMRELPPFLFEHLHLNQATNAISPMSCYFYKQSMVHQPTVLQIVVFGFQGAAVAVECSGGTRTGKNRTTARNSSHSSFIFFQIIPRRSSRSEHTGPMRS